MNSFSISHRIIVSDKHQVLVFAPADCAFVQRMNDSHVGLLLKAQQATFMELHTVAAIRTDTYHGPYHQGYLLKGRVSDSMQRPNYSTRTEQKT